MISEAIEATKLGETVTHDLTKTETQGSFEVIDTSQNATPSYVSRVGSAKPQNNDMEGDISEETKSDTVSDTVSASESQPKVVLNSPFF